MQIANKGSSKLVTISVAQHGTGLELAPSSVCVKRNQHFLCWWVSEALIRIQLGAVNLAHVSVRVKRSHSLPQHKLL